MVAINKAINKIAANKSGFGLLETVLTIIIIGLSMGAIVESFIVGSAKSVNIVNQETAVNIAKKTMAEINYCRNGGNVNGVCNAFSTTGSQNTWDNPPSFITNSAFAQQVNNQCFYATITASNVDFADPYNRVNGNGIIQNTTASSSFIQTIVKTGWFALNSGGSCPSSPPASYPFVTVSTVFANY